MHLTYLVGPLAVRLPIECIGHNFFALWQFMIRIECIGRNNLSFGSSSCIPVVKIVLKMPLMYRKYFSYPFAVPYNGIWIVIIHFTDAANR